MRVSSRVWCTLSTTFILLLPLSATVILLLPLAASPLPLPSLPSLHSFPMDQRKDLNLTDAECIVVGGDESSQVQRSETSSLMLVGKLMTTRHFNSYSLKTTMKSAWRPKHSIGFRPIQDNLFIFQFGDVGDKERVIKGGPWAFEKSLLLLREPGMEQPSKMTFERCDFWIRVYDLPLPAMTMGMGRSIGNAIGNFIEADEVEMKCGGSFLRIRVSVDVTKPLLRGIFVKLEGKLQWVDFKYERLPNFCYKCGRLGHIEGDCDDAESAEKELEYGDYLRASPLKHTQERMEAERTMEDERRQEQEQKRERRSTKKSLMDILEKAAQEEKNKEALSIPHQTINDIAFNLVNNCALSERNKVTTLDPTKGAKGNEEEGDKSKSSALIHYLKATTLTESDGKQGRRKWKKIPRTEATIKATETGTSEALLEGKKRKETESDENTMVMDEGSCEEAVENPDKKARFVSSIPNTSSAEGAGCSLGRQQ